MDMIIFIGLQAAGKSTFYQRRFVDTHQYISKDLLKKNREPARRQQQLVEAALQAGQSLVIDNTNPTLEDRAALIELGKQYQATIIGYFFLVDVKQSLSRNKQRIGQARVPDIAIFSTRKRLIIPSYQEGFDQLYTVKALDDFAFAVTPFKREDALNKQS